MAARNEHWEAIYSTKGSAELSWFEESPVTSLRLITSVSTSGSAVVDVGCGTSFLVDRLFALGYRDITLLDVSQYALDVVRARLVSAEGVEFVHGDVLSFAPSRHFDVWHDRAVFHFLVSADERFRYVELAASAVGVAGSLILGEFGENGPTSCSGLPVARHGATEIEELFSPHFMLDRFEREEHVTPWGSTQAFNWMVLKRL